MKTIDFEAVLDEHFPEPADIVESKHAIRSAAAWLHEDVPSVQSWMEEMRERARDQWDPED